MLPENDLKSGEIIRPFLIMQPQYRIHNEDKKVFKKKKGKGFNPRCEAPNSLEFFKEMNQFSLKTYDGQLNLSDALDSEMQRRGINYINISDDTEYRSLYGEKNPIDNQKSRDVYLHLMASYQAK